MPSRKEYTPEFKDQAVRFVLEEIEPNESRKQAYERLAISYAANCARVDLEPGARRFTDA